MNRDNLYEFFSEIYHYGPDAKVEAFRKFIAPVTAERAALQAENARLTAELEEAKVQFPCGFYADESLKNRIRIMRKHWEKQQEIYSQDGRFTSGGGWMLWCLEAEMERDRALSELEARTLDRDQAHKTCREAIQETADAVRELDAARKALEEIKRRYENDTMMSGVAYDIARAALTPKATPGA